VDRDEGVAHGGLLGDLTSWLSCSAWPLGSQLAVPPVTGRS
jgi:hypothetical protein